MGVSITKNGTGCPEKNTSLLWCFSPQFITRMVAQMVKNLPATQEARVGSLGWEDPLEKEMAILFSILAWEIPWTEEPGGLLTVQGSQKSWTRLSD